MGQSAAISIHGIICNQTQHFLSAMSFAFKTSAEIKSLCFRKKDIELAEIYFMFRFHSSDCSACFGSAVGLLYWAALILIFYWTALSVVVDQCTVDVVKFVLLHKALQRCILGSWVFQQEEANRDYRSPGIVGVHSWILQDDKSWTLVILICWDCGTFRFEIREELLLFCIF